MAGPIAFYAPSYRSKRFDAKYRPDHSGCWIWTANADKEGYGIFRNGLKSMRAHRFSYESYIGPIPAGLFVLHRCDNPSCVNPAHLFVGTQKENIADMIAKGRDTNMQEQRKRTHCPKGHQYEIGAVSKEGKRYCRACNRIRANKYYWRNK